MKKSLFHRVFFPVMILLLVATLISTNLLPIVTQAATPQEQRGMTNEEAATVLNKLQALKRRQFMQEIEGWKKEQNEKKIKELNEQTLKGLENTLTIANKSVPGVVKTIKDALDGDEFDTAGCISTVVDLTSGILACIVPWGTIASVGIQFAQTIFTAVMGGESGPTAEALMEDRLNQRLDNIVVQLSEVQNQLTELSDEINQSTEKIISSVSTALENESDKNYLREFMLSSGKYDFSYNQLRNYLYGKTTGNRNASTAYYAQLQEAQLHGGTSEEIEHYYNLLYSSLWDNRTSFHDYVLGIAFGKSMVATYYDVLSARPDLVAELGKSAELAAIEFAYDLYQTELLMDQLILACNNYQYTKMIVNGQNSYDYGTGKLYKTDILNAKGQSEIAPQLYEGIDNLREQFAKDFAYILDVTGSYVVEDHGEYFYLETSEVDGVVCAKVLPGQTVYLNTIPAGLCDQFDLKADAFDYSGKGVLNEDGIVKIDELNLNTTISLKYTDTEEREYSLGGIKLVDANNAEFSGGEGTADSPYLISNREQFLNIANGMDKHYRLIAEIDFENSDMDPIGYGVNSVGDTYQEFTGVLDGNGYKIYNLKIRSKSETGIFGKIGAGGIVKNLVISDVKINVDISYVGKSSVTFTGGTIAGTNNGTIQSCTVFGSELIVESNTTNETAQRNVFFKYGGVAGANCGSIIGVLVGNSKVDVSSTHDFGGGETKQNYNNVFVGGICGTCTGTLQYAGVDKDVVLRAYAKSVLNPDNTVKPHLKAFAGGITTNEELELANISNVYSLAEAEKVTADNKVKVESNWPEKYTNAKKEANPLIPGFSEEALKSITVKPETVQNALFAEETYAVTITDKTELYKVGETELKLDNLDVMVNGQKVKDYQILNMYGFNTYNDSYEESRENVEVTVLLFTEFDGNSLLVTKTFPIQIGQNYVKKIDVINYETQHFKNAPLPTTAFVEVVDANGKQYAVPNADITVAVKVDKTGDSGLGKKTLELGYQGATCEVEIEVLCDIHYTKLDYNDPTLYTYCEDEKVTASCQHGGYDIYCCNSCGEKIKTNRVEAVDHIKVRDVSREPTCNMPGEIGAVYCIFEDCDIKIFEEKVEIPQSAHTIVHVGDAEEHKCTKCGEMYQHEFAVSESIVNDVVTYTYACSTKGCGYVAQMQDTNIITYDYRQRPTVVVGNGYALKPGDLVTVYVDLENCPVDKNNKAGVEAADFGIRYHEDLELVAWYDGDFFKGSAVEMSKPVSCGYNFVWADAGARAATEGNLLKLVFRVPENATLQDRYEVKVIYTSVTGSGGGFAVSDSVCDEQRVNSSIPQKFITKEGVVRLVDHLPGDLDGNGVVNLMDALYISHFLVNKDDPEISPEYKQHVLQYGDVDLASGVTPKDIVRLLQSVSGGYGASLLIPEYEIQLNTNGYTAYQPDPLLAQLYGENNTYAALAEIEKQMQQREGYKFLGWYTRLEGGDRIGQVKEGEDTVDYNVPIVYDVDQKIQTLYAHWQRNSVSFNMNDATSEDIEKVIYNGSDVHVIDFNEESYWPKYEYAMRIEAENAEGNKAAVITMYREFEGWDDGNGKIYSQKDTTILSLSAANIGNLELTAIWGDWKWEKPVDQFSRAGYTLSENLYCTASCAIGDEIARDDFDLIEKFMKNQRIKDQTIYFAWDPVEYNIKYVCDDVSKTVPFTYEMTSLKFFTELWSRAPQYTVSYIINDTTISTVDASSTFSKWVLDNGEAASVEYLKAYFKDKEPGATVSIYAKLDVEQIELLKPTPAVGYNELNMWYYEDNTEAGEPGMDYTPSKNCKLYASWVKTEYTVTLDANGGNVEPGTIKVTYDDRYDRFGKLPTPTRTGHSFDGWKYVEKKLLVSNDTSVQCAEDHTLVAQWTAAKVSFDSAGGSACSPITIASDGTYAGLDNVVSTRTNDYEFLGWYYNGIKISSTTQAKVNGDHTLTAKWVKIKATVGYYSRDFEIGSHSEAYYPGMDRQALLDAGYTRLKLEITIDGDCRSIWHNAPVVYIYSHKDALLFQTGLDRFKNVGGWSTRSFEHVIYTETDVQTDCSFWIRYGNDKDNPWYLGDVEITITAIRP